MPGATRPIRSPRPGVNDAKEGTEGNEFRRRQFLDGYAQILQTFVDDFQDLRAIYVVPPFSIIASCCDIQLDLVNEDVLPAVARGAGSRRRRGRKSSAGGIAAAPRIQL